VGQWQIEKTRYYPSYGKAVATHRVIWQSTIDIPTQVSIFMDWQSPEE